MNARKQISNPRKHLVFFLIGFIVTLMLHSSMAFESPLVNSSFPSICFSTSRFSITVFAIFLIAITFDFISHNFKFTSLPLQKNIQLEFPLQSDSQSGTLICRPSSSRFSFSNVNLSPVLTNCISWIDLKLKTLILDGILSMNVQHNPTWNTKFGIESSSKTPLCFLMNRTNSIASRFIFSDNRLSPTGLSFFGGSVSLNFHKCVSVWTDSRNDGSCISWIDRKNLKPENRLSNGPVDLNVQQLLYPTQKIKIGVQKIKIGVESRNKTPLCFSENRTNFIASRFIFSNINLNLIDYISMGMEVRTATGISFTSWINHDPKNLNVFLSCFKPVNVLLDETEQGSTERSDMNRLNPRIDQPQTASTSYGSVFNFEDLKHIKKDVRSELGVGQKALKPKLLAAGNLLLDGHEKLFLEAKEDQIVQKHKKQAAEGNQKRDTTIKSLNAAEATKRRLEQVEIERKNKKEFFRSEIARRKVERALILKMEIDALSGLDWGQQAQKLENESLAAILLEVEEGQSVQKHKKQAAIGNQKRDATIKSLYAAEATKRRLEKVEIERKKKKEFFHAVIARRKVERALILKMEEAALSRNKKKCEKLSETKRAYEKQALKVKVGAVKFCSEESQYIISPYHRNPYSLRKCVPSWASEYRVTMALPLQQKLDPESIFGTDSFCSVDEVLLP